MFSTFFAKTSKILLAGVVSLSLLLSFLSFLKINTNAQIISLRPDPDTNPSGIFIYEASPGEVIEDRLILINTSDLDGIVELNVHDSVLASEGSIAVKTNNESNTEVGTWVDVETGDKTVAASEAVEVPFTITIPSNATPREYAGGFSLTPKGVPNEDTAEVTSGAASSVRTAVMIYILVKGDGLTVDNAVDGLEIFNPDIDNVESELQRKSWVDGENVIIRFFTENKGTVFSRLEADVTITTPSGEEEVLKNLPFKVDLGAARSEKKIRTKIPLEVGVTKVKVEYTSFTNKEYSVDIPVTESSNGVLEYELDLTQDDLDRFTELAEARNGVKASTKATNTTAAQATNDDTPKGFKIEQASEKEPVVEEKEEIKDEEDKEEDDQNVLLYSLGGIVVLLLLVVIGLLVRNNMKKNKAAPTTNSTVDAKVQPLDNNQNNQGNNPPTA